MIHKRHAENYVDVMGLRYTRHLKHKFSHCYWFFNIIADIAESLRRFTFQPLVRRFDQISGTLANYMFRGFRVDPHIMTAIVLMETILNHLHGF